MVTIFPWNYLEPISDNEQPSKGVSKMADKKQNAVAEQKTAEMKARNDARDEAQRNKPSGFTPQKNISFWDPSAVAFRRQHNISDDVGAGC